MARLLNFLRREPLVWFLLAGVLLFGAHRLVSPGEGAAASRVIHVDRNGLLEFMQQRARAFGEKAAATRLDEMAPEEVSAMVEDMAREEAKYREALRLGLDKTDYVMRRRLVQSLDYVADNGTSGAPLSDDVALRRYFEANRARYRATPSITFSHVFFSAEAHGWKAAEQLAAKAQERLNSGLDAAQAPPGDRFLYMRNYAERSPELIESHFGKSFVQILFGMRPDDRRWQGPLRSNYGFHLVRIVANDGGQPLSFVQARAMVAEDAAKDEQQRRRDALGAGLLAQFTVDVGDDVRKLMAPR